MVATSKIKCHIYKHAREQLMSVIFMLLTVALQMALQAAVVALALAAPSVQAWNTPATGEIAIGSLFRSLQQQTGPYGNPSVFQCL
jgi:hypothetical protein